MNQISTFPSIATARLLTGWLDAPPAGADTVICGLADDSRDVRPGYAFVALPGRAGTHGWAYAADAVNAGAEIVIADCEPGAPQRSWLTSQGIPWVRVGGLADRLPDLAARMYPLAPGQMKLIAVTGTNGKSTVVDLLSQLLPDCATMGTNGVHFADIHGDLPLTTNTVVCNYRHLYQLQASGARYVALEASSIGIEQGRLRGLPVDIAVLTNISRDHLDYHPDMETYAQVKFDLFRRRALEAAVINVGDTRGAQLASELDSSPSFRFRVYPQDPGADLPEVYAYRLEFDSDGVRFCLSDSAGQQVSDCRSSLLCAHNVENLLAAVTVALALNCAPADLRRKLPHLRPCPGRSELYRMRDKRLVIVDYAHTPDALNKLLDGLGRHGFGRIDVVFGCGGNRDRGKRAQMGEVVARHAARIIITCDNPRDENPDDIFADILEGIPDTAPAPELIADRAQAIVTALSGGDGNPVVIAGRGNEARQVIAGRHVDFRDLDEVRKFDHSKAHGAHG